MLRNTLLFLSRQQWLRRRVQQSRLTRPLVNRFIAGETLDSALGVARKLSAEGIWTSLDRLGENVSTIAEAEASLTAALNTLDRITEQQLPATISIKLTQFGLDISEPECRRIIATLVDAAKAHNTRIEIDMESSAYTDRTLAIVREMNARQGNVRSVIQAYLHRSEADVETLCREKIPIRLCKGAYLEPPEVAFPDKHSVDENYRKLMQILFTRGTYPALATHDEKLIREAQPNPPASFEYQMLYGIRRDLQRDLIAKRYRLRLYVPYGSAWYPYFMRRLAERPANLFFLLRSLVHH